MYRRKLRKKKSQKRTKNRARKNHRKVTTHNILWLHDFFSALISAKQQPISEKLEQLSPIPRFRGNITSPWQWLQILFDDFGWAFCTTPSSPTRQQKLQQAKSEFQWGTLSKVSYIWWRCVTWSILVCYFRWVRTDREYWSRPSTHECVVALTSLVFQILGLWFPTQVEVVLLLWCTWHACVRGRRIALRPQPPWGRGGHMLEEDMKLLFFVRTTTTTAGAVRDAV